MKPPSGGLKSEDTGGFLLLQKIVFLICILNYYIRIKNYWYENKVSQIGQKKTRGVGSWAKIGRPIILGFLQLFFDKSFS